MSQEFEYPGLSAKIADALSFQRHAEKLPPSRVSLNAMELTYIWTCISYYVSSQSLKKADEAVASQDARDAARWREAIRYIGARYTEAGEQAFRVSPLLEIGDVDLMKGSVVEHFTNAIDSRIARSKAPIPDTLPCETE